MNELEYMKRALELARRGAGLVSPNPMVGAVLVKGGQIVGEGYHRYDWLKHAEVCAIDVAGPLAAGSTLYCTLEPCCHHGRTPPCTDALIEAGITRAIIAMKDPDPRVSGRGIELLQSAGIAVEVGLCEQEASRVNEAYLKFIQRKIPFVSVAVVGPGAAWKPSEAFLERASEADAIMLGPFESVNLLVASYSIGRARHRPLIIIGATDELERFRSSGVLPPDDPRASLIEIDTYRFEDALAKLVELRAHSVYAICGQGDAANALLRIADRVIADEG
jgi:pyrimidine deaminase RibD-like protein